MPFSDYLKMRMSTLFSPFTLHKPYGLLMFLLSQAKSLAGSCSQVKLVRDLDCFRRANPEASEEDVWNNTLKHTIPQGKAPYINARPSST